MPNWCENNITIYHDNQDVLKKIQEELREDWTEEVNGETRTGTVWFSFSKLVPMPKEIRNTNSPNNIVATQEEANAYNEEHKNDDFLRQAKTQEEVDKLVRQAISKFNPGL